MAQDNRDFRNLTEIANSPDGQKLLQLARQRGGDRLKEAMEQAQGGDYQAVKTILSEMLADDEAKALIQRIRHE